MPKKINAKFRVGDLIENKRLSEHTDINCYLVTKCHTIPFFDTERKVYDLLQLGTGAPLTDGVRFIDQYFQRVS